MASCEECLQEFQIPLKVEEELFGSRLFKVAKVGSPDSETSAPKIVKIFPYTKATFRIAEAQQTVLPFCKHIANAQNLLPITSVSATVHYIFLIRDFVDNSLTERLCTRPFLCPAEKRWIAFQLLCALSQLHTTCLCHGDIKSENVLLTSWGWLLLADPAPFKPVLLPSDNPSEFTYFFDSSRRRVCYLAPERFIDASPSSTRDLTGFSSVPGNLNLHAELDEDDDGDNAAADAAATGQDLGDLIVGEVANEDMHCEDTLDTEVSDPSTVRVYVPSATEEQDETIARSLPTSAPILCPHLPPSGTPLALSVGSRQRQRELRPILDSYPGSAASSPADRKTLQFRVVADSVNSESDLTHGKLTSSMDLFSAGCVLLELFTDGTAAFTLSDLLSYRQHESGRLTSLLSSVSDANARLLITNLISLDADSRGSADKHLAQFRGTLFPDFFYTDLQSYLKTFLEPSMASPVTRLAHLHRTLPELLNRLRKEPADAQLAVSVILCNLVIASLNSVAGATADSLPITAAHLSPTPIATPPDEGSAENSKVYAVFCLLILSDKMPSMPLFDRVLPHLVELTDLRHHSTEVRRLALDALTQILLKAAHMLKGKEAPGGACASEPQSSSQHQEQQQLQEYISVLPDMCFLNEFLLPSLAALAVDPELEVRLAMARCLPGLAEVCLLFSDMLRPRSSSGEHDGSGDSLLNEYLPASDSDSVLKTSRGHIRERLVTLFSDSDNFVRRSLMETQSLAKLATFFGRSHSNDTILSHMVTFLNDKDDQNLRSAFFRQVGPLAGLFGAQSVGVLRSLLEQGLSDPDDTVLEACLRTLCHLLRRRLLNGPLSVAFLQRVLSLTAHPAQAIRQACVAYITAFARSVTRPYPAVTGGGGVEDPSLSLRQPLLNDKDESLELAVTEQSGLSSSTDPEFARFVNGDCGLASLYARLFNTEVNEAVFVRPLGPCLTNDAILLANLQAPLRHGLLDTVVSSCISVASTTPGSSGLTVCKALLGYLQERKSQRLVTHSGEMPCYTLPGNESISQILTRLQSIGLTEFMEGQLLQLSPLLLNRCALAQSTAKPVESSPLSRSAVLSVVPLDASTTPASATGIFPRARWLPLLFSSAESGVSMRRLHPLSSQDCSLPPFSVSETFGDMGSSACLQSESCQGSSAKSFIDIISHRVSEGLLAMPNQTLPRLIFARGLTIDDDHDLSVASAASTLAESATAAPSASRLQLGDRQSRGQQSQPVELTVSPPSATSPSIAPPVLRGLMRSQLWSSLRPRGTLVVHLHEHKPGHISLATHPSGHLLASCSSGDGLVKFWDCGRLQVSDQNSASLKHSEGFLEDTGGSSSVDKSASASSPDLASGHFLPARSFSTYSVRKPQHASDKPTCRHLVWTDAGSSVATIADRSEIHLVDGSMGCQRSCIKIPISSHGMATFLTAPLVTAFPPSVSVHSMAGGTDHNLLVYSATNGSITGHDIRSPQPVWSLKQDRIHGLIRCLAVHSGHTWLVSGTSRGHIVSWDLRYQREISFSLLPYDGRVSIMSLQIWENPSCSWMDDRSKPSTLILAATDRHNEIAVFDLEAPTPTSPCSNRIFSTWGQPGPKKPLTFDETPPYRSVHAILCLPSAHATLSKSPRLGDDRGSSGSGGLLPNVIAGGSDSCLRLWGLSRPKESCIIAWGGHEEALPLSVSYKEVLIKGVRMAVEEIHEPNKRHPGPQSLLTTSGRLPDLSRTPQGIRSGPFLPQNQLPPAFPLSGHLEVVEATRGHTNIISDLALIDAGQAFLVSASMNGTIKFWK
ncbi:phosphoinositide-3-kinase, regulatory subunit 4 [Sparganum proliferum]